MEVILEGPRGMTLAWQRENWEPMWLDLLSAGAKIPCWILFTTYSLGILALL